jgi:hypothetical protein
MGVWERYCLKMIYLRGYGSDYYMGVGGKETQEMFY